MAMTPYVTVYSKDGTPHFTYAATVKEWLQQGYTMEAPGAAKLPPELEQSKLPTAGREANRENPIISGMGEDLSAQSHVKIEAASEAEITEPVEVAPARPAPRRRASAHSGD